MTDFENSFTDILSYKFAIKCLRSHHTSNRSLHYLVKYLAAVSFYWYLQDLCSDTFLPRNALSANARSWDRMSSVCPSVYPSVTLVDCDHIRWKSWKLIAWTISPTPSGTWGNLGETRGGVGKKWRAGEQKRQYLWNAQRQRKSYYGRPIETH